MYNLLFEILVWFLAKILALACCTFIRCSLSAKMKKGRAKPLLLFVVRTRAFRASLARSALILQMHPPFQQNFSELYLRILSINKR